MLSTQTLATVKATAPILEEQGEAITQLFYKQLFLAHPDLHHIFNPANQVDGAQSRALAEAVFKYAQHIDRLEALGPMVNRIAHKHASVQVAPEHYPIVGKYLLAAIQAHLQLSPEDPILSAWAEAYQALAQIFIATETDIYENNANKEGGWRGFRPFVLQRIVSEAPGVKSFELAPQDGLPLIQFEAGQYVGVQVQIPNKTYRSIRQYSLSNAPGESTYRITLKVDQQNQDHPGEVSHYLHQAQVGDIIHLQPPTGDFTLKKKQGPIALIAGGVGITPLMSILLNQIKTKQNLEDLLFIQCARHKEFEIMGETLRELSKTHAFAYKTCFEKGSDGDLEGYLDPETLQHWIPDPETDIYFCGPKGFMKSLHTLLTGIGFSERSLNYEVFGPTTQL